ncbi:molecular chaperone HtpG, partial [Porphyromonas sp.]|uniref:molecular chaperone HtpG n=1 Tax=Porphyromonas sp. TaxID=1924944 RepID=UPI003AB67ABB
MNSNKGQIGVTSENIFPVIKKFLYSEHDIFLREIVSNAVDATTKLRALIARGTEVGSTEDLRVEVLLDKEARTLTVRDYGIGMTADEVERYINQIAFSGAEDFLEKYKDASGNIIGHFGLGFYSAFMVSERVEIDTLSYQPDAQPVHWSCDGSPAYEMSTGSRTERGTDIIMHLDEESSEFLEQARIEELLTKYCRFLPIPIIFGKKQEWKDGKMQDTDEDNVINDTNPLWLRKPQDLTDEDYREFYRKLYPGADEPLFWIHLNVDYPFTLTGVLYFPKVSNKVDLQSNKIKLYCNQVFVTDEVESIVPMYLTLLHGVIDSPDIPLNVSRSYLQSDSNVKKISTYITKKVADKLEEIMKNDRPTYEAKWPDLSVFIHYGILTDEKMEERALKSLLLLEDVAGKFYTPEEYRELVKSNQTDKDGKLVYLYAT